MTIATRRYGEPSSLAACRLKPANSPSTDRYDASSLRYPFPFTTTTRWLKTGRNLSRPRVTNLFCISIWTRTGNAPVPQQDTTHRHRTHPLPCYLPLQVLNSISRSQASQGNTVTAQGRRILEIWKGANAGSSFVYFRLGSLTTPYLCVCFCGISFCMYQYPSWMPWNYGICMARDKFFVLFFDLTA